MVADLVIFVVLVAAFLLGAVRGGVRQLLAFGAWLVTFLLAAHLRAPFGEWLAGQNPEYSRAHSDMVAFLGLFVILFGIALIAIEARGATVLISRRRFVDEIVGGLVLLFVALFAITSLIIALDSYYSAPVAGSPEYGFAAALREGLAQSAVAGALRESVVPNLLGLLGPLLPANVRAPG